MNIHITEPDMAPRASRSTTRVNSLISPFRSLFRRKSAVAATTSTTNPEFAHQKRFPNPQGQCALLTKLPFEIRSLIYQHLFSDSLIHLVDLGPRLAHIRCSQGRQGRLWDGHRHGVGGHEGNSIIDNDIDQNDNLIALCHTCRTL